MTLTNDGLPWPIYEAMRADPYSAGTADYTPTSLIAPPLMRELQRRHKGEVREKASGRMWSFFGSCVHAMLERVNIPGVSKEVRVYADVDGFKIGGQYDLFCEQDVLDEAGNVVMEAGTVYDFKVCKASSYPFGVKDDWTAQINVLAWLLRQNGHVVKHGKIIPIYRDWEEPEKDEDAPTPSLYMNVPMWDDTRTLLYLKDRIGLHESCKGRPIESIPLCSPAERWEKAPKWAIVKNGNTKATRVLDANTDAQEYLRARNLNLNDYKIEFRPAIPTRCVKACSVAQFCSFGREALNKHNGDES